MADEVLTRGKMEPIIKDLKEFIASTIKGSESNIRKDLGNEIKSLKVTVEGHSGAIMDLSRELKDHGKQLAEINQRLTNHDKRFDTIETKIDKIGERLDDHEGRITTLETARL